MLVLIASADGAFEPEKNRELQRPVVLMQGGIHSGEIDGKDAGLRALREMLQGKSARGVLDTGLKIRPMVLPDAFIEQDSPAAMYVKAGLDAKSIVAKAFAALGRDLVAESARLA